MTNSHNNITCPKCHSAFSIDKSDYALISQQVRTKEFNLELEKKVKNEVSQYKKILEQDLSSKFNFEINEKNNDIIQLKNDFRLKEEQYKNKYKELGDSDKAKNYLELALSETNMSIEKFVSSQYFQDEKTSKYLNERLASI